MSREEGSSSKRETAVHERGAEVSSNLLVIAALQQPVRGRYQCMSGEEGSSRAEIPSNVQIIAALQQPVRETQQCTSGEQRFLVMC